MKENQKGHPLLFDVSLEGGAISSLSSNLISFSSSIFLSWDKSSWKHGS